jgi:general secretion pathway protein G
MTARTERLQQHARARARALGFTLIELMVALTIVALLLSIVAPRYWNTVSRAEDAVLRENLRLMRDAIDKHYADLGRYPESLQDLVERRYIRAVPVDPITQTDASWALVAPREAGAGGVFDIRSGAPGAGRDGKAYETY